ncbi:putative lipid II flippase FtsW [Agaribacterium haliotis]|uniref:putative lipid II flippase FtsW n=1 Tax=Agaribacterium haliotis TaxID=2013869 RepID=UPI001EFCE07C|nr:putative lipid II flippase FtsW [Agaribacterium haliotis]
MMALSLNYRMPSFSGFNTSNSLFVAVLALASFGLLMVATSSIDFAAAVYGDTWYFAKKQMFFLILGLAAGCFVYMMPTRLWHQLSPLFLFLSFALLILVLVPGIGKVVNGSRRWLNFGPFGIQASELAKFCLIIFYASYLTRRAQVVSSRWLSFGIMVGIIALTALLLLLEPDFGSCVIICFTLGTMMFVAGVPVLRFVLLSIVALFGASVLILTSDYRRERLLSFMDPFADPYDGGYQLVQSLIAFGRGDWFGLGLGNSIQKLFFLPDAHTDFIFAIIAEEFGLFGVLIFIALFAFFIAQILRVALKALTRDQKFGAYLCVGVAALLAMQAFINMGVASGLLPTKGLTLPFISYGGSSLVVTCSMLALVFRVQNDLKQEAISEE